MFIYALHDVKLGAYKPGGQPHLLFTTQMHEIYDWNKLIKNKLVTYLFIAASRKFQDSGA